MSGTTTGLRAERLTELRAVARCAFPDEEWAIWEDLKEGGYVHVGNARGVIPEGEMATAEDAEPNPVAKAYTPELATHIAAFDPPTVLALLDRIAQLERERDEARAERDVAQKELGYARARIENYEQQFPCDGGCNGNDGPAEECSAHGRQPRDLWGIISELAEERNEARAKVESITSQWRATGRAEADAHRRAEKAEAALERVTSDEFKQKITKCIPREHRGYGTSREILALIRNETGGGRWLPL